MNMNAQGQLTEAQKAGGLIAEHSNYDTTSGQMKHIRAEQTIGGQNVHDISYEYGGFGNLDNQTIVKQSGNDTITSTEGYFYDKLHRLKTTTLSISIDNGLGTVQTANGIDINYDYDAVGNIKQKSDYANNYDYNNCQTGGPNAVCEVEKINNGGTVQFSYDAVGNMTVGDDKNISYNAFNKPTQIITSTSTTTFSYGTDQSRYKQSKNSETTYYLGKSYEEQYNGEQIEKARLYMGDAILTEHYSQGSIDHYSIGFVLRDRLGSVVTIVDENGDITDNKSYDAFGKPRTGSMEGTQTTTLEGIIAAEQQAGNNYSLQTNRGFTDHEHLDDSQLIHMNGRVYDYNLGRFLSVDPFIQDPGNSQSMNPYSYIMNNPLAGVDPSGYNAVPEFGCLISGEFNCDPMRDVPGTSSWLNRIASTENGNDDQSGTNNEVNQGGASEEIESKKLDLRDPGQVDTEGSDRFYAKRESGGSGGNLISHIKLHEFYTGGKGESLASFLSRLAPGIVELSDNDSIGSEYSGYISFNKSTNQYGIYISGGTGPAFSASEPILKAGFDLLPDKDTIHIHNPEVKLSRNFKKILRNRLSSESNDVLKKLSKVYLGGKTNKKDIIEGLVRYSYNFVKARYGNKIIAGRDKFSPQDYKGVGYLITRNKNREILYHYKNNKPTVFTTY